MNTKGKTEEFLESHIGHEEYMFLPLCKEETASLSMEF